VVVDKIELMKEGELVVDRLLVLTLEDVLSIVPSVVLVAMADEIVAL